MLRKGDVMETDYEIISVRGHYEVRRNGKFICSADTYSEAKKEIEEACLV